MAQRKCPIADFEWDPRKEIVNVFKHGIDFTTASLIWDGFVSERPDRCSYGEARFVAFGIAESRILAVVYTPRGAARRIISARIAARRERRLYEEEVAHRGRPPPN
ncbi:MAG TPA: BrnT family toxin [Stellaceae bacterium]|nr:BrnT family toxin [Stellaceae bacterium]